MDLQYYYYLFIITITIYYYLLYLLLFIIIYYYLLLSSSEDNQLLLHVFSKWCTWSGLIVRVEKCKTFGVRKTKTTSIQYKPYLKICNEMVPQVEINDRFKYLGKEFSYDMTTDFVEAELKEDMTSYLKTLDSLPLHPHHKVSVITK